MLIKNIKKKKNYSIMGPIKTSGIQTTDVFVVYMTSDIDYEHHSGVSFWLVVIVQCGVDNDHNK